MREAGGEPLGPTVTAGGRRFAVVRDPFGAIVAVTHEAGEQRRGTVGAHVLHTNDHAKAIALYASLFGWAASGAPVVTSLGTVQGFSWEAGGETAGFVTDGVLATGRTIHPQWLFFFVVNDMGHAVACVEAERGLALPTVRSPSGDLMTPCDDAQGAAFALLQPEHRQSAGRA
jgi:predicted enzyme related to lactoylglutathione lyase